MVQLSKKSYLYSKPKSNMQTKTYLVRGDKVSLLDEQIDDTGQDWLKINYKGRKNLTIWIKAEAIELINEVTKPQ